MRVEKRPKLHKALPIGEQKESREGGRTEAAISKAMVGIVRRLGGIPERRK